jgi:hypothetical protein
MSTDKEETRHRVMYVKKKINMLFDVALDIVLDTSTDSGFNQEDKDEAKRNCLEIMAKYITYDSGDYMYKIMHQQVFSSLIDLAMDKSTSDALFALLCAVVEIENKDFQTYTTKRDKFKEPNVQYKDP